MTLMQQLRIQKPPTVFIMRFDVPQYNISPHQMPHESILTIYRALKVWSVEISYPLDLGGAL